MSTAVRLRTDFSGTALRGIGKAPGNVRKLADAQRQALADIVERGPIPAIHEVVRWRRCVWRNGFGRSSASRSVKQQLAVS